MERREERRRKKQNQKKAKTDVIELIKRES